MLVTSRELLHLTIGQRRLLPHTIASRSWRKGSPTDQVSLQRCQKIPFSTPFLTHHISQGALGSYCRAGSGELPCNVALRVPHTHRWREQNVGISIAQLRGYHQAENRLIASAVRNVLSEAPMADTPPASPTAVDPGQGEDILVEELPVETEVSLTCRLPCLKVDLAPQAILFDIMKLAAFVRKNNVELKRLVTTLVEFFWTCLTGHPRLKASQCSHWHHQLPISPRLVGLFHSV